MSIFQKSVVNKYLKNIDEQTINQAFERFTKFYGNKLKIFNIIHLKEENYQEGFLREIFVNVLGYTINPDINFNLTTEFKNQTDSKKADGAILINGQAIGVIELKSTKTAFIESITNQAFNYKHNQANCRYVITSNFHFLRFYIDNSTEFEEFDLFELSLEEFKRFYLFLSKESIFNEIPLKLKEETKFHEESITVKFYRDYKQFKDKIFENLVKNNPQYDKLTLFKKTQKLLDRFIFIWFAEDSGLVAPNMIANTIQKWKNILNNDAYFTLLSRFQTVFKYLNEGYTFQNTIYPAFNGGLFKTDEIIDNPELIIDDDILLNDCLKISTYDFNTEIDVNILGHIFEHSLNEIEGITAELKGETLDKKKTKRKKDGIFYTPKYITRYIVDNSIGTLSAAKKKLLKINEIEISELHRKNNKVTKQGKELFERLQTYKKWLFDLKILDPACGSGAFLNEALDFLIAEHKEIDEFITELTGKENLHFDIDKTILENNIFGVDINDESVEIAKLSLWLRTAKKDRPLSDLNNNIKCGNSLIAKHEIDSEKAFDWNTEFSFIMQSGGFDIIIGNPPYVFTRENINEVQKDYYINHFKTSQYQANLYILFIEKSIELLKTNGYLGFIIPNAWLMVSSAEKLRQYLINNTRICQIVNFLGETFEQAGVEPVILNLCKKKEENYSVEIFNNLSDEFQLAHTINISEFTKNQACEFTIFLDDESNKIINKLKRNSSHLNDCAEIKAGLKAYEKGKGNPKQNNYDVETRPFDFKFKKDNTTHKYLEGRDVLRYAINWTDNWLQYGEQLAAPRTFNIFSDKKIIIREIAGKYPKSIIAVYTEELFLFNMSNIAVLEKQGSNISLKYILALLNSKLMSFYFLKNTAKSVRNLFPKIILNDLRKFPIKQLEFENQQPFIELSTKMLALNEQLNAKQGDFYQLIQSNLNLSKLTEKIKDIFNFDFKDFLAELKKQKIEIELKKQKEWIDLFNDFKKHINELQYQINKTDTEIDNMVYEIYELTTEEIAII